MVKRGAAIWFKVAIGIAVVVGILNAFIIMINSWKTKK
jgi:hypothetical protein